MEDISHPKIKDISLEKVLKALGDPVRMSVVKQLIAVAGEEKACGAYDFEITKATFSHHIKILIDAGVIRKRQEGTRQMTSLRSAELKKKFPGLLEMIAKAK